MRAKNTSHKSLAIASWSGGKDCCLACYKAQQAGYRITRLINFVSRESRRSCFHGLDPDLIRLQARRIGIPLRQMQMPSDNKEYENEFKSAVSRFHGVPTMIFGDIYLDEHKQWVERVCGEIRMQAVEPLWNSTPAALMEEFISLGFRALVVSCRADKFGQDFVGRFINRELLRELTARSICPSGEHGEYHTLVVDGPLFSKGIEILESEPVLREGFWKSWVLDIKHYR